MGAKKIFGALLGLIVIISLAAGRIIIQYPQNLYNEDDTSKQFNPYAQEELNNYNGHNLRPYPYNSPTGYSSMQQSIPMEIQIRYRQIPAMTQRMPYSMPPPPPSFTPRLSPYERLPVHDDIRTVKRSAYPTLDEVLRRPYPMPSFYNERPTSNAYPVRSIPYERQPPYFDEERSVKRIDNFDLENLDKIPDFMQKPIFNTLDLSNIMALSDVGTNDAEDDMERIKRMDFEILDNIYKQPIFDFAKLMALSVDIGGNDDEEDVERIEPKANEPTFNNDDDNTDDDDDEEKFKNIETFDEDKVAREAAAELNDFIKELLTETEEDATNNLYEQLFRDVIRKSFNNENYNGNRVVPETIFDLEPEVAASTGSTENNENNYMVFLAHFFIDPEQGITLNTDINEGSNELAESSESVFRETVGDRMDIASKESTEPTEEPLVEEFTESSENELIANVDEKTDVSFNELTESNEEPLAEELPESSVSVFRETVGDKMDIASKESTESKEETLVEVLTESSENELIGNVDEKTDVSSNELAESNEEPLAKELPESSLSVFRETVGDKMNIASKESTEPTEELTESSEYENKINFIHVDNAAEDSDEVPVHIIPLDDSAENNKKFEYVVESGESNDQTDNVQPEENSDKVTVVVHNIGFNAETNEFEYLPNDDSDSDAEAMKNYLLYEGYF